MGPPLSRLAVPSAVLGALLLVTAVGAAWYVRQIQASHSEVLANNVASVRAAQELEVSIREVQAQFDRYLITGRREFLEPIPLLRSRTEDALAEAERLATTPPEQALMARVRRALGHFFREYEGLAAGPPEAGLRARLAELSDPVLDQEILDPAHEYLRLNEGMMARATKTDRALAGRLTAGLLAIGVCGAAGGLLSGWALAAAVRRAMRRAEDRLEQSERDALRAEQLAWAGQLAAGVAHEVRNPLMAIKLVAQAAADPGRGHRLGARDLAVLEEEIGRLEELAATFLDFARPPTPDLRPVALGPLVEQAVERVRARAELQGVRVFLESVGDPGLAEVDPNQVRQVVYNLLFNALEAQPAGGWARVSLRAEPGGAGAITLVVEDGGPGLPPGLGDRIFEPFVSTNDTGLGLGLSICRRVVVAHGGDIRAANRPGGGARFTVLLPATRAGGRTARAAGARFGGPVPCPAS